MTKAVEEVMDEEKSVEMRSEGRREEDLRSNLAFEIDPTKGSGSSYVE